MSWFVNASRLIHLGFFSSLIQINSLGQYVSRSEVVLVFQETEGEAKLWTEQCWSCYNSNKVQIGFCFTYTVSAGYVKSWLKQQCHWVEILYQFGLIIAVSVRNFDIFDSLTHWLPMFYFHFKPQKSLQPYTL